MKYRILITGSRSWDDIAYIRRTFQEIAGKHEEVTLVSGACPTGADRLGEVVAAELGWNIELHPANWSQHGNSAGFVRNAVMVDTLPDMVIGFVRNKSKGASMTINLAKRKGLWTVAHSWVDYPYTRFSEAEFNSPESKITPDVSDEGPDRLF